MFVGAIALAIAIPFFQASLCTPAEPFGDNASYRITIDRPANSDDRDVSENPAINEFSFGPSVAGRIGKIDRTEASYYTPKQEEDWGRRYWCDVKASDYFLVLFTLFLAISTFFLWRETERLAEGADDQSKKMRESIDAANRNAIATHDAANAMQEVADATDTARMSAELSTQQQLRAYIGIISSSARIDARDFRATLTVANRGQTPAFNVHGSGLARFGTDYDPAWESDVRSFETNGYILPNGEFYYRIVEPIARLAEDVPKPDKDKKLFVMGRLEYRDAFSRDRWLTFRFTVAGDLAAGKAALAPCQEGNDAN